MVLREIIPKTNNPAIISYSLTDTATGKGYLTLYAGQSNTGATLGLSVLTFYSDNVTFITNTFTASVTPTKTTVLDRDYDLEFEQTALIEGLCFVNVPSGVKNGDSAGQNHEWLVLVKLRRWDGTTETEIASATGRTHTGGSMAVNAEVLTLDALSFEIPKNTIIVAGETLRLTIQINHSAGGAVNSRVLIAQDPKGRSVGDDTGGDTSYNWGSVNTQLTIHLPLKPNI